MHLSTIWCFKLHAAALCESDGKSDESDDFGDFKDHGFTW
jgi:hypothetical protein